MEDNESHPAREVAEETAIKQNKNSGSVASLGKCSEFSEFSGLVHLEEGTTSDHESCRKRPLDPEIEPEPSVKRKSASVKERLHWKRKEQLTRYKRQLQQEERELRIQQRRDRNSILPQKTSPRQTPSPSPASLPQKRVTFSSP